MKSARNSKYKRYLFSFFKSFLKNARQRTCGFSQDGVTRIEYTFLGGLKQLEK